ncbi:hypothetical protein F4814DRAFT_453419 [Daldinia grandis]|nr:hypothetical protein F4814DRAFT_453419 [Daldinia grandis]
MAMDRDEENEARDAGPALPSRGVMPRWYSDGRISLIVRAFEDARRNQHTDNSDIGAAEAHKGDDDAAAPERSKIGSFVIDAISTAVPGILSVDVSNVNPGRSVSDHGIDSLVAAELRNWFLQALGAKINM